MTGRWAGAALRSAVWLGAATWLAYLKRPSGASVLAVRADPIGWMGSAVVLIGLSLHVWSNVTLARGEEGPFAPRRRLVDEGPYRYVRNPIYLAGVLLLTGTGLLYASWRVVDLIAWALVALLFHVIVIRIEEPALKKELGAVYEDYCRRVPRWLPVLLLSKRQR